MKSEEAVRKYFENKNYKWIKSRLKLKTAEVDLLFYNPCLDEVVAVEVKTFSKPLEFFRPLSKKQFRRLINVQSLLQSHYRKTVRVHLAIVSQRQEIDIYEDFLTSNFY